MALGPTNLAGDGQGHSILAYALKTVVDGSAVRSPMLDELMAKWQLTVGLLADGEIEPVVRDLDRFVGWRRARADEAIPSSVTMAVAPPSPAPATAGHVPRAALERAQEQER
jgi:hypothetical protein